MHLRSKGQVKKICVFSIVLLAAGCFIAGCVTYQSSSIVVARAGTYLDDGKLFVYLDGKLVNQNQPVGKGQTRTIAVSNGVHKIWVRVESLESDKIQFTVENNTVNFKTATERIGGTKYLLLERGTD